MDLWIRSQDKRNLKKINTEIYIKKGLSNYAEGDVYFIVSSGTELGEYKTKDRALEVLDEIHKCIIDKEVLDGCNNILTLTTTKILNEVKQILDRAEKNAVYEMPKE